MSILDNLIHWLGIPQNTEAFKWTRTKAYQKRLDWVKNTWIVSSLVMLIIAQPAFILVVCFFLTFLSLAFLEKPETPNK